MATQEVNSACGAMLSRRHDARALPIRQPITSFGQRVARLLGEEQAR
jgi:hypothetical protein